MAENDIVYEKVMRPHKFVQVEMMDGDPHNFEDDPMITVSIRDGFVTLMRGNTFVAAINATKVRTVTTYVEEREETIAVAAPEEEAEASE